MEIYNPVETETECEIINSLVVGGEISKRIRKKMAPLESVGPFQKLGTSGDLIQQIAPEAPFVL